MDNCSHNGDKVKEGILAYADAWVASGLAPQGFSDYLRDGNKVSFPWSMIDKITPRPNGKIKALLASDGFEDNNYIETEKHTFTAPFVNSEEVQYLVIENHYTSGRPPLDLGGALFTTRETVDKVETMKVTTCLHPKDRLHRGHACSDRSRGAQSIRVHRRCHQSPPAEPLHA